MVSTRPQDMLTRLLVKRFLTHRGEHCLVKRIRNKRWFPIRR